MIVDWDLNGEKLDDCSDAEFLPKMKIGKWL